jgi:hypothetical protein
MGLCPMHCQCCIMWSRMGAWCMQSQSPETTLPCSTITHRGINPLDFTMKLWDSVDIIASDTSSTLSCTWLDTGGLPHLTWCGQADRCSKWHKTNHTTPVLSHEYLTATAPAETVPIVYQSEWSLLYYSVNQNYLCGYNMWGAPNYVIYHSVWIFLR